MQRVVADQVKVPPGYSISWSGQFEFLERATAKLKVVVPATLLTIFVLLYLTFKRFDEAALLLATLPFALAGGFWLLWLLGHHLSVAGGVGFIALAGVAAEFGVIMLLYLKQAWEKRIASGRTSADDLLEAIREGAVLRVRPKAMTVAVILAGLLPIMVGSGTGSEVMQRIAAPMVGGMITAPLLSMFVIPAAFLLMRRRHSATPRALADFSGKTFGSLTTTLEQKMKSFVAPLILIAAIAAADGSFAQPTAQGSKSADARATEGAAHKTRHRRQGRPRGGDCNAVA
jgi:Cu(I)/Ag(I) efflux system membrane protein CusA/SilA